MGDTGLLVTHAFWNDRFSDNTLYQAILAGRLNVNEGMLTENIVAQSFRANGRRLFFYSCGGKTSGGRMDIDFLSRRDKKICPVEVKSSTFKRHTSLDKFMKKFSRRIGESFILYQGDVMRREGVIHLPLYMAGLL